VVVLHIGQAGTAAWHSFLAAVIALDL
jgi:hypothetical protein